MRLFFIFISSALILNVSGQEAESILVNEIELKEGVLITIDSIIGNQKYCDFDSSYWYLHVEDFSGGTILTLSKMKLSQLHWLSEVKKCPLMVLDRNNKNTFILNESSLIITDSSTAAKEFLFYPTKDKVLSFSHRSYWIFRYNEGQFYLFKRSIVP